MFDNWNELIDSVESCKKCNLCNNRKDTLKFDGNRNADIMFIGKVELKLLDEVLIGLGINGEDIYITDVIKCSVDEKNEIDKNSIGECLDYLRNEVILIKPKIIVLLGDVPLKTILGNDYSTVSVRGNFIEKKGIYYMPTYSLQDLIIDDSKKIYFWKDIKNVIEKSSKI